MALFTLKLIEDERQRKKVLWLLTSFRWYVWGMSLKLLEHTSRHCCRNSSEKQQQSFIVIVQEWEVIYLLKSNFKCNLQKHHFVYVSEVVIKCYPNFITWFTTCAQKLMKIWKTKIGVKFWILLLLLQISYIFVAFTKDLNIPQKSTENWTFAISFTLLCKSGNAWVKYLAVA